jgi:hypothetical protein
MNWQNPSRKKSLLNQVRKLNIKMFSNIAVEKQQEADTPSGGLQRPSTAPGRVRPGTSGTFVNKLKKGIQFGANENLMNIPENVNSERVAELEQELEV